MNQKQKAVLLCAAAIIGFMVIFPPYVVEYKQIVFKSGYGFILNLPTCRISSRDIPATINVSNLFVQMLGALIVGGLTCIAFKKD